MARDFSQLPRNVYRHRNTAYERIPEISLPKDLRWVQHAPIGSRVACWHSKPGMLFKRIRDTHTGETIYYRRKGKWDVPIDKERIDTEPKKKNTRYVPGTICWFIGRNTLWYLVVVTERTRPPQAMMTIKPYKKMDADGICEWPFEDELVFRAKRNNSTYTRLRPLSARTP
jgi:hypothetical protein